MTFSTRIAAVSAALMLSASAAVAACPVTKGSVRILANDFPALHAVVDFAEACIGDGANDMAMLQAAGFGVAFHGKPLLREKVALQLNHTDLTGLLYLQGYRHFEFAKA